jgi:hypothetical protein
MEESQEEELKEDDQEQDIEETKEEDWNYKKIVDLIRKEIS